VVVRVRLEEMPELSTQAFMSVDMPPGKMVWMGMPVVGFLIVVVTVVVLMTVLGIVAMVVRVSRFCVAHLCLFGRFDGSL
jgi:hypothetical protein